MCAGQQLCKLLPLQKFGVAHLRLYCGAYDILFWINTSLKNRQIGLSSDRVTSVPGTHTRAQSRGYRIHVCALVELSHFGIMTWGNKAAQASNSLPRMLSHQQKHCPAQDAPWLHCARDVPGLGLLLAVQTGTGTVTSGIRFPRNPLLWSYPGRNRAEWQSPVRPQSKAPVVRTQPQLRIKQRTPD